MGVEDSKGERWTGVNVENVGAPLLSPVVKHFVE